MVRRLALFLAVLTGIALLPLSAGAAAGGTRFTAGSAGIGDAYFPGDGNGGFDVDHYDLTVRYEPSTGVLTGTTVITATATQDLSRFDLDFKGLHVDSVTVRWPDARGKIIGGAATWTRKNSELMVTPAGGLPDQTTFTTTVRYHGVPVVNTEFVDGFVPTADGAVIMGEPHVAATWYPVNDHPSDKATHDLHITVPKDLEAVSNGLLVGNKASGGWRTWNWSAPEPMASYLVMAVVGNLDLHSYKATISPDGPTVSFVDAIAPELFTTATFSEPRANLLKSQQADESYKRLTREIVVPSTGDATLSFEAIRDTELDYDFMFVEAHTVGMNDWTTLKDSSPKSHTSEDVGQSCPALQKIHPWLRHYQSAGCKPTGTSGQWWAATGNSTDPADLQHPEQWQIDLTRYAGRTVEISISYASDEFVQGAGVFLDNLTFPTGQANTSFEIGNDWNGWTATGPPEGSVVGTNTNTWAPGTPEDLPHHGDIARATFARQPEFLGFLASRFGPYPFSTAGGVMDDKFGLDSSLETQTRPVYAREHFSDQAAADIDVIHELSHEWFGDSLTIARWQDIWLNEGFATYAEWIWSEHINGSTAADIAAEFCATPADDPFWKLKIADPGPDHLFDDPIYYRGALLLQQLQTRIEETGGDNEAFFDLLKAWTQTYSGDLVTTKQFVELAELRFPNAGLATFFDAWLNTMSRPECSFS